MNVAPPTAKPPRRTQVLIIGAGPVGLTLAGLLGQQEIDCVLIERRTETLRAPAAHVLRNVPRAILALLGVDEAIEAATSPLPMKYITWCTTLGGQEIGRLDITGDDSGTRPWTNLSQNRLEPILRNSVGALGHVTIVDGARSTAIRQHDSTVDVDVELRDGSSQTITADWVVAADGAGSRTRDQLGIEMGGAGHLGQFFMVHFRADLSPWVTERPGPILWIANPEAPGTLIIHDVTRSHVFMTPVMGLVDEEQTIAVRLEAALAIPLTPDIVSIDTWTLNCQVADRYREGRCFLVGDAAHRFPPSGGLGMNTGIAEAFDLAMRFISVLTDGNGAELLDHYETECRPVALANANESLENAFRLSMISDALGDQSHLADLETRLNALTDTEQKALAHAVDQQWSHFMSNGALPPSVARFAEKLQNP